jgi:peptide chain release factor 2
MLLRMYLRWARTRGWKTELMEVSGGDVAGIKSPRSASRANTPTAG